MCATVCGEDLVVEVFDTETESRYSDRFQCFELRLLYRAGLALESDLFSVLPAHVFIQTIDEITQLALTDVRRCAAAEISKTKLPPLKRRHAAVELVFFDQRVEIDLDLRSILVRVDFEITEETTLPAEGDVNVKTQGIFDSWRLVERVEYRGNKLRLPLRERRLVRDKIIPYFSSGLGDVYRHGTIQISIFPEKRKRRKENTAHILLF